MHVLFCFDENYAKVSAVSMLSLLRNNIDITIHVFTVFLSDETKAMLTSLCSVFEAPIYFYNIDKELDVYKSIFLKRKVNYGTFGRLMAARILPPSIDRILYLDGDTLILDNVSELNECLSANELIAGVYDMAMPNHSIFKKIPLKSSHIYINAGILFINLKKWRDENLENQFLNYLKSHPLTPFFDQDAINVVCEDRIKLLTPNYNFTFISSELPLKYAKRALDKGTFEVYSDDVFCSSQKSPKIIHFASELFGKPWLEPSCINYVEEWRVLYKETPWSSVPFKARKFSNNRYINSYKKFCDALISKRYKNKKYRAVVFWYKLFYKLPHKIQGVLKKV